MTNKFLTHRQSHILQFLFLLLIGSNIKICAQNLLGKVVNEKQLPLEYANIILLNPLDSVFINGTVCSDTGEFSFSNILSKSVILKISCLGYLTKFMNIENVTSKVDLGEIALDRDTNLLNEITITASSPPFTRKGNSLLVNVNTSRLSLLSNAENIITHIPGIIKDNEGFTVFGKGAPIIYLNNRKLYDYNELKQIQSSDIVSMELIRNPGAEYDAEGRAVLLIKSKNKKQNGWAIHLSELFNQQKYFYTQEDAGLTYTHNNISLFTTFNQENEKSYFETQSVYSVYNDTTWKQLISIPQIHITNTSKLSMGFDWSVNAKHAIGAQYQYTFGNGKILGNDGIEDVYFNEQTYDKIITSMNGNNRPENFLLNAFYIGKYGKYFQLNFNLDYITSNLKTGQYINETSNIANRNFNILGKSDNRLYAGKLVLKYQLKKNSDLEFGSEYNRINSFGFINNQENYIENNSYGNNETKTAGFANYNTTFGNLNLQVGIRYESDYWKSKSNGDSIFNKKYKGIYPNLSLNYTANPFNFGLEISRKVQRPSFSLLSGNNYYVNRFLTEKGNPYIKNEDIYQCDFLLKYKMFDFTANYTYTVNPLGYLMDTVPKQSPQSYMTYTNYPKYEELNFLLTSNFEWKIWKPRITLGLTQPFFSVNYLGKKLNRNSASPLFQFYNDFVLPKKYYFSFNFMYIGNNYRYCTVEKLAYKTLDIALKKSFYNDKLLLQIQMKDLFKWIQYKQSVLTNNISFYKENKFETRYFEINISYRFNNYEKKYRGKNADSEDIKRL